MLTTLASVIAAVMLAGAAQSSSIVGWVAASGQALPGVTVVAIPETGGVVKRAETGAGNSL